MIKIGILLKSFENLRNFELRIIQKILDDKDLELSLVITDGRKKNKNPRSFKNKFLRLISSKNKIGIILYNIQYHI